MIDLVRLPQNVMDRICTNMDNETILKMRKVSKSIKEIVDLFIVSTQKTKIMAFSVKYDEKRTIVSFLFKNNFFHYCVWKSCFNYVMTKLEITSFNLEDNRNAIQGFNIFKRISATLNTKDVGSVFKHLKPFIRKTKFSRMILSKCPPRVVRACTEFLGSKTVFKVFITILKFESHNDQYNNLFKRTRAQIVTLFIEVITKEALGWLANLDDIVKRLYVSVENSSDAALNAVSIARELLRRKGKPLMISYGRDMAVSFADTEVLLQILHKTDRKACIYTWTNEDHPNVTIGVWSIKKMFGERRIIMEHLDKKPMLI